MLAGGSFSYLIRAAYPRWVTRMIDTGHRLSSVTHGLSGRVAWGSSDFSVASGFILRGPGRSCVAFSDLGPEVIPHRCHCTLVKVVPNLPRLKGAGHGMRPHFLMGAVALSQCRRSRGMGDLAVTIFGRDSLTSLPNPRPLTSPLLL